MSHWYITLPSNSSHAFYPNNTLTSFSTRLQSTCSLTGDWEVALVEMSFPRTWYTIESEEGENLSKAWFVVSSKGSPCVTDFLFEVRITSGYYDSIEDIVDGVNSALSRLASPFQHTGEIRTL